MYESVSALKPSQVSTALELAIEIRRPAMLWGAPGIGKSAVVAQTAARLGLQVRDIRAALLDPVDLRGLPHINGDGRAHWATPDFLPRDGSGVLFFDELTNAPNIVQGALYQLFLDRRLGDYVLPDGWAMLGAGNRETDRAAAGRMGTALANRFMHFECIADADDWRAWAVGADIAPEVSAFIAFRPELLHSFDPQSKERAFPSPRTWEYVSDVLKRGAPAEIEHSIIAGIVGDGAAVELMGFLQVWRQLPSIDGILLNPDSAAVPTEPAALYAVSGALARKATGHNFDAVCAYAKRMPQEFSVFLVRDAVRRDSALQNTRAFISWGALNSAVMA